MSFTTSDLVAAITSANANNEADILELSAGCTYKLTAVDNTDATYGANGLPIITTDITIHGNGATITHNSAASAFRLLQVNPGGTLKLTDLTLDGGNTTSMGGAVFNHGTMSLADSAISNNTAAQGGGGMKTFWLPRLP